LDHFLSGQLLHLSRSRIQALIKTCHILLNGAATKPGATLRANDTVSVEEPPPQPVETRAEEIPLDILYEDDDLIVLNKAAGMVVHPAAGNWNRTLVNALLHHCPALSGIGGEQRPGIVHRLDKETSGCIVVAKNDAAHQNLAAQFAGRKVLKVYLALVAGHPRRQRGTIEEPIGRHPIHRKKMAVAKRGGRPAKTDYRVVREWENASLVECTLHTGRTHQIRVHLTHLGHPLLGDKLYGGAKTTGAFPRQMLHAWKLGFFHPRTGQWMEFEAPQPADFANPGL
jgi:23S rRNA pseudouridine1911/1915/1917 synthase